MDTQDKYLRDIDVRQILGLSRGTLYQYRRLGILPYVKIGKTIRYAPEHLATFIAARERGYVLSERGQGL